MIRFTLTLVLFFIFNSLIAQDNIIFRNGDDVKGKVLEVTDELVKFKPADNPDGPVYSYKKAEIFLIKYENGKKDVFNEQQNTSPAPIVYSARPHRNKSDDSVFSFFVRTGYEYLHRHEKTIQYAYPGNYYEYFALSENNFYIDILAGRRRKHYQFGAGLGFYFKDLRIHDSDVNTAWGTMDIHDHFQGIGLSVIFSNRIYLFDKKYSPFIIGDVNLAIDNVFEIEKGDYYDNYYDGYGNYGDDYPYPGLLLGGGLEMKTNKKCKIQIELGIKLSAQPFRENYNRTLFHTGLSFVY